MALSTVVDELGHSLVAHFALIWGITMKTSKSIVVAVTAIVQLMSLAWVLDSNDIGNSSVQASLVPLGAFEILPSADPQL
jgi:hypothetical protein